MITAIVPLCFEQSLETITFVIDMYYTDNTYSKNSKSMVIIVHFNMNVSNTWSSEWQLQPN